MLDEAAIVARARALLVGATVGSDAVRASGRVGVAIPVVAPGGAREGWFVPVLAGDRIAAFFQLLPDGELARYSSFERRGQGLGACPPAEVWVDAAAIRRRVEARARPGEAVGEPALSYDEAPARLAWAVPVVGEDGAARRVFVAGNAIWEARPPGGPMTA